jgi:GNAT superfamily N-acetyltransferase
VSGSSIDVHELRPSQHEAIRALILSGLAEHWGTLDPLLNEDLDDFAASYGNGTTLVACHDGRVVGTGTVIPRDTETAEIVRMSVAPAYRRSGLGRRLVENLVEAARRCGARRIVLETSAQWTEVVQFYKRCGFTLTHFEDSNFGPDAWFERRVD